METFCPGPLRRFPTPESIVKLDEFDDWFVQMHMGGRTGIGAGPEKSISEISSP